MRYQCINCTYQTWVPMTQSRIKSRFRIKCFSLESWVDLNQKMGKRFESWVNLSKYLGNHESIPGKPLKSLVESIQVLEILLESWADSNQGTWVECPKKVTQSQHLSEKPTKGQRNWVKAKKVNEIELIYWFDRGFELLTHDLNQYSRRFLSHKSIWIKILESFWVMSLLESTYSGSFLSRDSVWIKFQKSILSRELIWIISCKAIVSLELIASKDSATDLNRIKEMSHIYPCLVRTGNASRELIRSVVSTHENQSWLTIPVTWPVYSWFSGQVVQMLGHDWFWSVPQPTERTRPLPVRPL